MNGFQISIIGVVGLLMGNVNARLGFWVRVHCEEISNNMGEWLKAEPLRSSWKTMVVILGSSHSQAPWWRKKNSSRE